MPERPARKQTLVNGEQYLVFSLLEREFAFKAEHIQGVERLLDVTRCSECRVMGKGSDQSAWFYRVSGRLAAFLAMEPLPYNPRTRLLSVHYNEMMICLVVDGVSEMVPIAPSAIAPVSTRQAIFHHGLFPMLLGLRCSMNNARLCC